MSRKVRRYTLLPPCHGRILTKSCRGMDYFINPRRKTQRTRQNSYRWIYKIIHYPQRRSVNGLFYKSVDRKSGRNPCLFVENLSKRIQSRVELAFSTLE